MARHAKAPVEWLCGAPKCKGKPLDGSPYCAKHQTAESLRQPSGHDGLGWLWALLPIAGTVWCFHYAYQLVSEPCDQLAFQPASIITAPFRCVDGTAEASGFAWLSPFGATFVGSCLVALGMALALVTWAFLSRLWRRDQ